jgi:two-component system, NarL family, response regulator NreC
MVRRGIVTGVSALAGTGDKREISVVLADDHVIVRRALRMLLESEGCTVLAEAGEVADAIRYLRGHKPDVLILDLNMPGPGGDTIAAIPQLVEASPRTGIVILTMEGKLPFARRALREGVRAYVLKDAVETELVEAVRRAAAGETYMQPALRNRLRAEPEDPSPPGDLTQREVEVLRLLALGYTSNEIAGQLDVSVRTIESHRANINGKLGIGSRSQLVRWAIEQQLIGS